MPAGAGATSSRGNIGLVATKQAAPPTRRVYYGWIVVLAGMGVQALQAALLARAYGVYVVLLQADYGWSKTVFSGAFSLQQIESGLLGPLQGWMVDRFGPRAVMRVGNVLFGLGFMLFSRIDSIAGFYATFLLMAVGSSLGGFMPITVTIVNWFRRRRATAMGLMQTGMGVGGLSLPLVAWALNTYGWRQVSFISGVIVIVLGMPLVQLMRHKPEHYGLLPDGDLPDPAPARTATGPVGTAAEDGEGRADDAPSAPSPARVSDYPRVSIPSDPSFTARQALRTSSFWLISLGHGASLLVVSAVQVHMVAHLHESLGYSVAKAAVMVTLLTAMTMVGQIGGGFLGDRVSKRLLVVMCMLGHAIALLMLAYATALWMVVAFAVLHGIAWGTRGPLMSAIRADYFGTASFGTISGFSSLILTLGTVTGPVLAGVMADRFGNYRGGFTVLAVLAGLGSIFWLFARPPRFPDAAPETVRHGSTPVLDRR